MGTKEIGQEEFLNKKRGMLLTFKHGGLVTRTANEVNGHSFVP